MCSSSSPIYPKNNYKGPFFIAQRADLNTFPVLTRWAPSPDTAVGLWLQLPIYKAIDTGPMSLHV